MGNDRKGLPNSFLNRFIKLRIKDVNQNIKKKYLFRKYPIIENMAYVKEWIDLMLGKKSNIKI